MGQGHRPRVIDAYRGGAREGMGTRINTVMQPCFFQLAGVLPAEEAIHHIKVAIEATYGKRGRTLVDQNTAAVDRCAGRAEPGRGARRGRSGPAPPPQTIGATPPGLRAPGDRPPPRRRGRPAPGERPARRRHLPHRHRGHGRSGPSPPRSRIWDPEICIDCAKCAVVCPHAAIRVKGVRARRRSRGAPRLQVQRDFRLHDLPGHRLTVQVAPDDCTGCGVCVPTSARRRTSARSATRPSTWPRPTTREPSGPQLGLLRRSRR